MDLLVLRGKKASKEDMDCKEQWGQQVQGVKEEGMELLGLQVLEELMVLWVHLVNQVVLEKLDHQDIQVHLETKETWEWKESKAVLVFRAQEVNLESLEYQVLQEKWALLDRQEKMERKEVRDHWDLLDYLEYQVQEEKLEQLEALDHWEPKVYQ